MKLFPLSPAGWTQTNSLTHGAAEEQRQRQEQREGEACCFVNTPTHNRWLPSHGHTHYSGVERQSADRAVPIPALVKADPWLVGAVKIMRCARQETVQLVVQRNAVWHCLVFQTGLILISFILITQIFFSIFCICIWATRRSIRGRWGRLQRGRRGSQANAWHKDCTCSADSSTAKIFGWLWIMKGTKMERKNEMGL